MATLPLDHALAGTASVAADLPTGEALAEIAVAFLDAGMVRASAHLFSMAADAGADAGFTDAGRQRAIQIGTTDVAVTERLVQDGALMIPSAERRDDGTPRFFLPIDASIAGQPHVLHVIRAELDGDGTDAELRNFLAAFLQPGDLLVDCDPGFGLASLSAATMPEVAPTVIARAADADHATFLEQCAAVNATADMVIVPPAGDSPSSLASLLQRHQATQAKRLVIHAGSADDLAAMHAELVAALHDHRCAAVAWTLGSDVASSAVAELLESRGGRHFVVATDADGVLLVPEGEVQGSSLIVTIPAHGMAARQAA